MLEKFTFNVCRWGQGWQGGKLVSWAKILVLLIKVCLQFEQKCQNKFGKINVQLILHFVVSTLITSPLPSLDLVQLSTDLPDKSDTITLQVRFVGSSILKGTKAAIAADCFTLPVPEVISKMPSFATNSLAVEQDPTDKEGTEP